MLKNVIGLGCSLLLLAVSPAAAQRRANPPTRAAAWVGVWQGTLGQQQIRACFSQNDGGASGSYFYLSHLRTIALEHSSALTFLEGDGPDAGKPKWALDKVGAREIAGSWSQGRRTLPILLTRVNGPLPADESPCASLLFNQPRLAGIRTISAPAVKDGVRYTKLTLDHRGHFNSASAESFAIDGNSPAVQRINAALRRPLETQSDDGWFACVRQGLGVDGRDGDINISLALRLFTSRWLVAGRSWDGFCGGAHPSATYKPLLFDLQTGREVDVTNWFSAKAIERERVGADTLKSLVPAFRTFILAGWKADDPDCAEVVRSEDYWDVELTRTGFEFTPELPHVAQACADAVSVPFARAAPYLSAEGRANVEVLRRELSMRR